MKTLLVTTLFVGLVSVNAASAAQLVTNADGKERIGVVSASNAATLDELTNELSRKASERGATSFRVIGASGENRMHGVAAIYK